MTLTGVAKKPAPARFDLDVKVLPTRQDRFEISPFLLLEISLIIAEKLSEFLGGRAAHSLRAS